MSLRRLALVTDAWQPQTNGVVNTLVRLVKHLEGAGHGGAGDLARRAPHAAAARRTRRSASPSIRGRRSRASARSRPTRFTSRPKGRSASGRSAGCAVSGLRFTTSFHTRYPEYLSARLPVPLEWGYKLVRWFHAPRRSTRWSARCRCCASSRASASASSLVHWPRGVDAELFNPEHRRDEVYASCRGRSGSTSDASRSRRAWRIS